MPITNRLLIVIMVMIGLVLPEFSYSQETVNRPIKYVRGRIYDIDHAGSKIIVEWFYSTTMKIADDKMTFFVPDTASVFTDKRKIFKDVRPGGILDLDKGNHVVIKYYDDKKKGYPEAISITVMEFDKPIPP